MSRPRTLPIDDDAMVQVGLRLRGRMYQRVRRAGVRRGLSFRALVELAFMAALMLDEDGHDDVRADVLALMEGDRDA